MIMSLKTFLRQFFENSKDMFSLDRETFENPPMKITAVVGDMTLSTDDVVVNAADHTLLGGTGIDGAIHRAAGKRLAEWIAENHLSNRNEVSVATPGFDLPAKNIIHTVAPIWDVKREDELFPDMVLAYFESFRIADDIKAKTLSTVLLGAGAYGWRKKTSLDALLKASELFVPYAANLREIRIFGIDPLFERVMNEYHIPVNVFSRIVAYDKGFDSVSRIGA